MARLVGLLVSCGLGATLMVALGACATTTTTEEEYEEGDLEQNAVLRDQVVTFESGPSPTSGFIQSGRSRYALIGERVAELVNGKRYSVSFAVESGEVDGFGVRRLVDYRAVLRLVGTLADDPRDPTIMHLQTVHTKSFRLVGSTVAAYKGINASLPGHDYTKTFFRVNAVEKTGEYQGQGIFDWLDYAPVALYRCADKTNAAVHLDLIPVKPDASLLDGFIATELGSEMKMGAHAVCTRDATGYGCNLENVNGAWGTTHFESSGATTFDLVIDRANATKTTFGCATLDVPALSSESED